MKYNHNTTLYQSLSSDDKFSFEDIDMSMDSTPILKILISVVYSVICAVGLVGNLLIFFLMRVQGQKKSTINFFIINLAVTDFQFLLTLPFWAVDTALDFSWPFGDTMCKIILLVTVMNVYASVFFLTAMSVACYLSVSSAYKKKACKRSRCVKWVCAVLWVAATIATAPTTIFSTATVVTGEKLCLLKFPEGHNWLTLYHIQKILIAFIILMLIVCVNYLMLLCFVKRRSMDSANPKRRSRVTKSVTIVLSFFFCWMPNHVITLWGVLVKFNAINRDKSYYMVHTYVFPVTICLVHANSCMNPMLYCLMRPEIRKMLSGLFWKVSTPTSNKGDATHFFTHREMQGVVPLQLNGDYTLSIITVKSYPPPK